jgi:D-serine dehydratase
MNIIDNVLARNTVSSVFLKTAAADMHREKFCLVLETADNENEMKRMDYFATLLSSVFLETAADTSVLHASYLVSCFVNSR